MFGKRVGRAKDNWFLWIQVVLLLILFALNLIEARSSYGRQPALSLLNFLMAICLGWMLLFARSG